MLPDWLKYEIKEKLERLSPRGLGLRNWINRLDSRILIGILCACIFIFVSVVIAKLIPDTSEIVEKSEKVWFYDLSTGKLFVADSDKIPPIDAPSGRLPSGEPAGVRAYVLSFSEEPNKSEPFIGYLETLTGRGREYELQFRKSRGSVTKQAIKLWNKERLIRKETEDEWVSVDTEEGRKIIKEAFLANEKGQIPIYYPAK